MKLRTKITNKLAEVTDERNKIEGLMLLLGDGDKEAKAIARVAISAADKQIELLKGLLE